MEKVLKLYTYVDGVNDTPFPSEEEQIIIGSFTYTANRMGSSPTITATVKHRLCLDDVWTDNVYAEFNEEKYFIRNTPSSSKSNDDTRYEHDLELLSEREVLNHVYFIDAVQGDSDVDVYKSNSTKVQFFGDIKQFVERLNSSLSYSHLTYTAVVDEGITTEDKQVTFENQYIIQSLQTAFETFNVPFYFVGKTIHFGYTPNAITTVLKYGHDDALLSISKQNANYQIINRITGTGSTDNIPYYYPNDSSKGELGVKVITSNTLKDSDFIVTDPELFATKVSLSDKIIATGNGKWEINGEEYVLTDMGLSYSAGVVLTPAKGDTISQVQLSYITPSQNLMPSIYRESKGADRFYNAKNDTYDNPDGGKYAFENEYYDGNPLEGITAFDDIKPSIVGVTNASGQRIDSFLEFAYDRDDNDETDEEGNYIHPYFFAKLRKTDGDYGFNLFDQAIEQQAMQISFTSGICGACTFEIGVGEDTQKNLVQVGPSGALLRDENGNVRCGREGIQNETPQDRQNDTRNYEVWIALKKDNTTYPQVMPNVNYNYKPSTEDTFVILGINLPKGYILKAEKELDDALIKYMWENNVEKFTFSAKFSRIFFEENPYVLSELNENARVMIEYNGIQHTLYIDQYTYKMESNTPLPEIEVNLVDTLNVGKSSLQNVADAIRQDIINSMGGMDILRNGLRYFIRKDVQDTARGKITFIRGIDIGSFSENTSGGTFRPLEDGTSYAEVDRLRVRLKAYFETLEIINTNSVGGKMILTAGGGVYLREVKDRETVDGEEQVWDYYRCYFLTEQDGHSVENRFKIGDLAISQSFNIKAGVHQGVSNHYYWREVVGVGDDYVDLSKSICDTGSDSPMAEDTLVHLGNRTDKDRQGAIIFSSVDVFSPSIILYYGINDFSLTGKEYVSYGVDKSSGNAFFRVYGEFYAGDREQTSYVRYTPGYGVEMKGKFVNESGENISDILTNIQDQIDGAIETWFYPDAPTLENEPAVNWATDAEKNNHLGDLYYSEDGKAYRFQKEGDVYVWKLLQDSDITKALADAAEAISAAQSAQTTADNLKNFTDEAFSNGIIDRSEAAAIEKYINVVNETKKNIEGSYESLYSNAYLTDTAIKTALKTAYDQVTSELSDLLNSIDTAIADNIVSEQEKATVDTAYGVFSDKVKAYEMAVQDANKAIQDALKGFSDEALQAANEAMQAANGAKASAAEVKDSVDSLRDFTDEAFADGIISMSEAGGIASYINNIETFAEDVEESYQKVYNNPLLSGTDKTNLGNAYTAFNTAKDELLSAINTAISDNKVDTIEKANVDGKYSAFNTKYGDFIAYINAATRFIQDVINRNALDALDKIGELDYLKAALKEYTTIEGGLIQSSTLALGYTSDSGYNVMAGTSGIYDSSKLGGGIASWWGGAMFDRFEYTEETMPSNVAKGVIRMDGTGYLANGNLWWEEDGTLHADPLSFFVGPDQVGNILSLFQFVESDAGIEYVIPQYPFQSLDVASYVQIGNGQLCWDEENKAFYVRHKDGTTSVGFYATNFISAKGLSPSIDIGGGGASKLSELEDVTLSSPKSGQSLVYNGSKWVNTTLDLGASDWSEITGKPSVFATDIAQIGDLHPSWDALLKAAKPATLAGYGITDAYTKTDADGRYVLKTGDTMTGVLRIAAGSTSNTMGIANNDGSKTILGYIGDDSYVAMQAGTTRIRSGATNLLHRRNGTDYTIWDSYNDGSGSGLDADTVDGYHSTSFSKRSDINIETNTTVNVEDFAKNTALTREAGTMFSVNGWSWSESAYIKLNDSYTVDRMRYSILSYRNGSVNNVWNQQALMFLPTYGENKEIYLVQMNTNATAGVVTKYVKRYTDYDTILASNVASATKLQTARTIWGQSFDGRANVSGNMTGVGSISASGNIMTDNALFQIDATNISDDRGLNVLYNGQRLFCGFGMSGNKGLYINHSRSSPGWVLSVPSSTVVAIAKNSGINVGIGTESPTSKLHVSGDAYASGYFKTDGWFQNNTSSSGLYNSPQDARWYASGGAWNTDKPIIPKTNNTQQVGTSSYRFNYGYFTNMNVNGLTVNGNSTLSGNLAVSGTPTFTKLAMLNGGAHTPNDIYYSSYNTSGTYCALLGIDGSNYAFVGTTEQTAGTIIRGYEWVAVNFNGLNNSITFSKTEGIYSKIGVYSDGYVSAKGLNTASDERLKDIIAPVNLSLEQMASAPAIAFRWKTGEGEEIGSLAQYWQDIVPLAVKTGKDGWLSMQYGNLAMVCCVSLAKYVKDHEERLNTVEKDVETIKKMLKTKL